MKYNRIISKEKYKIMLTIEEIRRAVAKVGKKYGIKNAYLFGSYAKGEATENSDVDLLIDLGKIDDYMTYEGMRLDLVDTLGTEVDIVTTEAVRPRFFDLIKNDRIPMYGF